jgi:hypothetical protein
MDKLGQIDMLHSYLDKLKSRELREHAVTGEPHREVVIVEMDLPHPIVGILPEPGRLPSGWPKKFLVETPDENESESGRRIDDAKRFLKRLVGFEPRYLSSSQAFIVEANGIQLSEIAQNPLFAAVWPNRNI